MQVIDISEVVGKTVAKSYCRDEFILLSFTDDSFIFYQINTDDEAYPYLEPVDLDTLVEIGLISEEERARRKEEEEEKQQRERELYEQLKAKYEQQIS